MPKFLEDKLEREASKRHLTGRRKAAFVYGTMNNLGAMRGNKITPKGRAMQRKHDRDYMSLSGSRKGRD